MASITICGATLCTDEEQEYSKNVISRIEKAESIMTSWNKHNLTLNGRMLVVKTFAMSQIVFPSQFCKIRPKEIKGLELSCYKYVQAGKIERMS